MIQWVYMTAGTLDEARRIGRFLVTENLAACVNLIDGMESLYVWDGELQEDQEAVLIAKTTTERLPDLVAAVKRLHSYDCPCIVALPIEGGNPDFLDWVSDAVRSRKPID